MQSAQSEASASQLRSFAASTCFDRFPICKMSHIQSTRLGQSQFLVKSIFLLKWSEGIGAQAFHSYFCSSSQVIIRFRKWLVQSSRSVGSDSHVRHTFCWRFPAHVALAKQFLTSSESSSKASVLQRLLRRMFVWTACILRLYIEKTTWSSFLRFQMYVLYVFKTHVSYVFKSKTSEALRTSSHFLERNLTVWELTNLHNFICKKS